MFKWVGIGDLHFEGPLCRLVPDMNDAILRMVNRVLMYAQRKAIKHVVFYGDLWHRPDTSAHVPARFYLLLNKYPDLMFHIISGNHDREATGGTLAEHHSLTLFEALTMTDGMKNLRVHLYETFEDRIDGSLVRFLPWPSNDLNPKALNIHHLETRGAKMENGRKVSEEALDAGNHYCVAGHLHTNQKVGNSHYSGTLYQTTFGESLPKFFHDGSWDSKRGHLDIKSVRFSPEYELHKVVLNDQADLKHVPKDSNKLVWLLGNTDVVLPPDFLVNHPNVIKNNSFRTERELRQLETRDIRVDEVTIDLQDDAYLRDWLIGMIREGAAPKEVAKRALQIHRELAV